MKVTDPAGTTWRVSRRWVPWRRRLKGVLDSAPDLPTLGDDPVSGVVGVVMLVLAIPFVVLALVAGLELILLVAVLPFAVLARMLFGRHWHVEVRRGFRVESEVDAGSWQASGLRIEQLAEDLRQGRREIPAS